VAQMIGLVAGLALLRALYPDAGRAADDVVVSHSDKGSGTEARLP
jgi:hypothetical protein